MPPRTPGRPDPQAPEDPAAGVAIYAKLPHLYFYDANRIDDPAFGFIEIEISVQRRGAGRYLLDLCCYMDGHQNGAGLPNGEGVHVELMVGEKVVASASWTFCTVNFGRIINITSHAVKQPIDMLGLSNGARTGLTGFVAGLSRATVQHNVTINNLLPGTFDTDRLKSNLSALAQRSGKSADETTDAIRNSNPAKRFGTIDEFGAACAFLCSDKAGYITGQNFLIDGGAYPGTF